MVRSSNPAGATQLFSQTCGCLPPSWHPPAVGGILSRTGTRQSAPSTGAAAGPGAPQPLGWGLAAQERRQAARDSSQVGSPRTGFYPVPRHRRTRGLAPLQSGSALQGLYGVFPSVSPVQSRRGDRDKIRGALNLPRPDPSRACHRRPQDRADGAITRTYPLYEPVQLPQGGMSSM